MNLRKTRFSITPAIVFLVTAAFAQKVQVGYDKSVDFSKYKSYTVAEPRVQPTRAMLYLSILGSVDHDLKSKGLSRTESDGDLILIPEGGTEFGLNQATGAPISPTYSGVPPALNATMWTGAAGYAPSPGTYVPEGSLRFDFVDRTANTVIWSGTVKVKLDIERKSKSLELIDKAVVKLLKDFPPSKR